MAFENTAHSGKNKPAYNEEMESWLKDNAGSTKIRSSDDLFEMWSNSIYIKRLEKGGKKRLELAVEFTKSVLTPYIYEPQAFVSQKYFKEGLQIKENKILNQKMELNKLNRKLKLQHEAVSFGDILQLFIRKCKFSLLNKFQNEEK